MSKTVKVILVVSALVGIAAALKEKNKESYITLNNKEEM